MQRNPRTNFGLLPIKCFAALAIAACCLASPPAMAGGRGTLRIGGSWSGYPAHIRLAEQFTRERGVPTDVHGRNNARGLECLREGEVDVLIYSPVFGVPRADAVHNAFPDEEHQPTEYHFGRFAVLVVVHRGNSVRKLTIEQLHAVFSGKAAQWHDVAGTPRAIVRVGERPTAKSWEIMQQTVTRGAPVAIEPLDFKSSREVVAHVAKHPGAIGFCLDRREPLDGVRALRIARDRACGGIEPSPENILAGDYPLIEDIVLFTRPDGPELADEYCRFACGPDASDAVVKSYYYSSFEREQFFVEARVKEMQAGKGTPITAAGPAAAAALLGELVTDFVRAKELVQLQYVPAMPEVPRTASGSVEGAVERLETGAAELLVVDGRLAEAGRGRVVEMGGAEMVLGSRAVGVVVHPQNPFNELAIDDLRQILAGETDRWPGATGTAERMVLYGLPPASPLMRMADEAIWGGGRGTGFQPVSSADKRETEATLDKLEAYPTRRAKLTVRPDTGRVVLSVAAQPGALGLVDLTKIARHETAVKLLAVIPAGETGAAPPSPDRVPEGYPLARPVYLYVSPKASEEAKGFFTFLAEGNAPDALLAGGLVPRRQPDAPEAEVPAAYGLEEESKAAGPPARLAAAFEEDGPTSSAPEPLQDVLRGALADAPAAAAVRPAPGNAQSGTDRSAESAAAEPPVPHADRPTPQPAQAPGPEAAAPAAGDGSAQHPPSPEPSAPAADFGAWIAARAVPLALIGSGVVVIAVALGSLGMKRARHRHEVLRRYRA